MSAEWLIFIAIASAGVGIVTALDKGLRRIADRIDNQSRIADEVRQELNSIKARIGRE
jgi:archaellum component FlaC